MMKKAIIMTLCAAMLLTFSACSKKNDRMYTCDEIIKAYEDAGYTVWHDENACGVDGKCNFGVGHGKGNEFYFNVFDSAEAAEAYADENEWHVLKWLFSVIYGDPTWVTVNSYGNIVIEYEKKAEIKPFLEIE